MAPVRCYSPRLFSLALRAFAALALAAFVSPRTAGAPAAPQEQVIAPPFRGDTRLDARVTVAEKNRPLSEVLSALRRELRIPLIASRDTADDKVTLYLDHRPAAEVLALVARHLDFEWRRHGEGYELVQSAAGRRREAALRDQERAAQWAAIQARVERLIRLAALPKEKLQTLHDEVEQRRFHAPEGTPQEEYDRLQEEESTIEEVLYDTGTPAALALYRSLTPVQRQHLLAGREIRLSTADGTLPSRIAAQIYQAAARANDAVHSAVPGGVPGLAADPLPPTQVEVVVRLFDRTVCHTRPASREDYRVQLEWVSTSLRGTGDQRQSEEVIGAVTDQDLYRPAPPVTTETDDPDLRRQVELTFPEARSPPPASSWGEHWNAFGWFGGDAWPLDWPTSGDIAEALHRATGLEIVADSFVRARLERSRLTGRHSVVQILDTLAHELDYSWQKEGAVLRLRSRYYYRDRPEEVPERTARPWRERVGRAGVTLDNLSELAAALTDPQCRSMQEFWGWYVQDPYVLPPGGDSGNGIYACRHDLRFWASLTPRQRQAALSGESLPAQRLGGLQRLALAVPLLAPPEEVWTPHDPRAAPSALEIAAGGFRLQARALLQQAFIKDGRGGGGAMGVLGTPAAPGGGSRERPLPPDLDQLVTDALLQELRAQALERADDLAQRNQDNIRVESVGPPLTTRNYTFAYYLAGQPSPVRTVEIILPQPPRSPSAPAAGR
jgi:hypothetical protein